MLACQGRGSITSLVSETGGGGGRGLFVAERYIYDSFGQLTVTDPAGTPRALSAFGNPYFFTGREFDFESGLSYNRHRSWDPHTGRFLQEDPVGFADGTNLYPYAQNNPVNRIDPFGETSLVAGLPLVILLLLVSLGYLATPQGQQAARQLERLPELVRQDILHLAEQCERNPAQDKKLSKGEIDKLKKAGINPEVLKKELGAGKGADLHKDKQGNIYVKPKGGAGPGEPTGININQL